MSARLSLVALLTLAVASFAAMGQPAYVDIEQRLTAEQLQQSGLDMLSPAQLARLNQLLRDESAQLAKARQAGQEESNAAARFIGLDDKPIKSRLKGSVSGWAPGTVFELENGQRWKVLKGSMKMRKAVEAPEILVVPGIAGRWFLQVDEDLPKSRVYRID